MSKPYCTYEQQIELLKSKNLTIADEREALLALSQIGYFQLIGGNKSPFKNRTTKMYNDGVTLDDIVALYRFDEELRHIIFRYLLMIERSLKAQIAYVFCGAHGEDQSAYINMSNYNCTRDGSGVNHLVGILNKLAANTTDYDYITYQQQKYNNVPLWILINAVTFGTMSKMFYYLPQSLQSRVSRNYPLFPNQMESILTFLTKWRNVCAHSERLFSLATKDEIPTLALHRKLNIEKKGTQYIYGKRDLFAAVIALRYLLPIEYFRDMKLGLYVLISNFLQRCKALPEEQLLAQMGFPENWESMTRYKL